MMMLAWNMYTSDNKMRRSTKVSTIMLILILLIRSINWLLSDYFGEKTSYIIRNTMIWFVRFSDVTLISTLLFLVYEWLLQLQYDRQEQDIMRAVGYTSSRILSCWIIKLLIQLSIVYVSTLIAIIIFYGIVERFLPFGKEFIYVKRSIGEVILSFSTVLFICIISTVLVEYVHRS